MLVIPIPSRSLPNGRTTLGPGNIPVGTHRVELVLDIANMVVGTQKFDLTVEIYNGSIWSGFHGDFDGSDRAKVGNNIKMTFDFGARFVDGVPVPIVSENGWQYRAFIDVTNGPFVTNGGTLTLT